MFKTIRQRAARLAIGMLWLLQHRPFWVGLTETWLYSFTIFLVLFGMGDLGGNGRSLNWLKCLTQVPFAIACGFYALWAFRWAIERELMLWQAMLLYLVPLTLVVLVIGYQVNGSVTFLVSIFGFCVFWPLTRWFHDTIPE